MEGSASPGALTAEQPDRQEVLGQSGSVAASRPCSEDSSAQQSQGAQATLLGRESEPQLAVHLGPWGVGEGWPGLSRPCSLCSPLRSEAGDLPAVCPALFRMWRWEETGLLAELCSGGIQMQVPQSWPRPTAEEPHPPRAQTPRARKTPPHPLRMPDADC